MSFCCFVSCMMALSLFWWYIVQTWGAARAPSLDLPAFQPCDHMKMTCTKTWLIRNAVGGFFFFCFVTFVWDSFLSSLLWEILSDFTSDHKLLSLILWEKNTIIFLLLLPQNHQTFFTVATQGFFIKGHCNSSIAQNLCGTVHTNVRKSYRNLIIVVFGVLTNFTCCTV